MGSWICCSCYLQSNTLSVKMCWWKQHSRNYIWVNDALHIKRETCTLRLFSNFRCDVKRTETNKCIKCFPPDPYTDVSQTSWFAYKGFHFEIVCVGKEKAWTRALRSLASDCCVFLSCVCVRQQLFTVCFTVQTITWGHLLNITLAHKMFLFALQEPLHVWAFIDIHHKWIPNLG